MQLTSLLREENAYTPQQSLFYSAADVFPVLQSYEADTWYDATGRITFTNNRSLVGVGFSRPEWENPGVVEPVRRGTEPWDGIMKHAPAGYVFARTMKELFQH